MDLDKKLLTMYTQIKTSKKIFEYLYINGEKSPEKLKEDLDLSKAVYVTLRKMKDDWGVIKKTTKGKRVYYDVIENFRSKHYTQLNFFDKIRKQEGMDGVLFGDQGEISTRGVFLRAYMNNHSLYGFPHVDELNDFEFQILDPLIMELDIVFEKLKKLKLISELRKKNEQNISCDKKIPEVCISTDLILYTILFKFFRAVYEIIEQDMNNEKSYRYIIKLMEQACKIGKEVNLTICPKGEYSNYPDKSFIRYLTDSFLFVKNENIYNDFYNRKFLENDGDWFFNKMNLNTLEKFEGIAEEDRSKYMEEGHGISESEYLGNPILWWYNHNTGSKFYDKELNINESIAILSTSSLRESNEYKKNLDLRFDSLFSKYGSFIGGERPLKKRLKHRKVLEMVDLILFLSPIKNGPSITKFRNHKKVREFFSDDEINFMIKIFKINNFQNHNELEKYIWYKAFEKDGLWYDKDIYKIANKEIDLIEKKLNGNFTNFSFGEFSKLLEIKYKNNPYLRKKVSYFIEYAEAKIYFKNLKKFRERDSKFFLDISDDDMVELV